MRHVYLHSLALTIVPSGSASQCWDFVDSITLTVSSTREGTTLQPTTIAQATEPGCVQTLVVSPLPNVDLQPYIQEGASVTSSGEGVPPANDVTFDGTFVLDAETL